MITIFQDGTWLPLAFALLMGVALLVYAVLDGYDLGVGILSGFANQADKDVMIASIGPFWDANETWLVLAVGLLLIAFPQAQGIILGELYIPVTFMLIGLILRGVAFDFRVKAKDSHKDFWDRVFCLGSLLTAFTQGFMIGSYVLGFEDTWASHLFGILSGLCVVAAFALIGASWLIMKTQGPLQQKALGWAHTALVGTAVGILAVSIATPLSSARIFERWVSFPEIILLFPCPFLAAFLLQDTDLRLRQILHKPDVAPWRPFANTVGIYILCFIGLAYSFYPYIVPDQLLIVEAASGRESLLIILAGALTVLPFLILYTGYSYRVFWGKVEEGQGYGDSP